jgi:hypothetical protein
MGAILSCGTVAYAATALAYTAAALAGPVIKSALAGKKICWSSGGSPVYRKNGAYDESVFGHGTWRLVGDQLTVVASHGQYSGTITKENETFHIFGHLTFYRYGMALEASGKYCE